MKKPISVLILLLILSVVLAACEDDPTEEPPQVPPSNTLQPPFITQTIKFTETLTPSNTPTASDTPTPSETPTPNTPSDTPTNSPTPGLAGAILSNTNINLRNGPGTNFDVVATVAPNSDVEILGSTRNDRREVWYEIKFTEAGGLPVQGWVSERLVDDFGQAIPTFAPTSEFTSTPEGATAEPFYTATPDGSSTPIPPGTAADKLSDVNVRANCIQVGGRVNPTSAQTVSIYWWWWVRTEDLMQQHIDNVKYEIAIDGRQILDWNQHRTEVAQESINGVNRSVVYWYVPIGKLTPGQHTITYKATWNAEITDGFDRYGPGTNKTQDIGSCTITVTGS